MKRLQAYSIALTLAAFTIISCKKHPNQLPPETQTGAGTFGCLVNGEIFWPAGAQLSGGSLQCNYQYVDKGYYFILIARNRKISNHIRSVGIFTDSLKIEEGSKLKLLPRKNGNPSGDYFKAVSAWEHELYQTDGGSNTGELWIKKLDTINQIVSGTFWFDATDANGQKVEVREGRFDVHYTR